MTKPLCIAPLNVIRTLYLKSWGYSTRFFDEVKAIVLKNG